MTPTLVILDMAMAIVTLAYIKCRQSGDANASAALALINAALAVCIVAYVISRELSAK